jgi:hypothetical protein
VAFQAEASLVLQGASFQVEVAFQEAFLQASQADEASFLLEEAFHEVGSQVAWACFPQEPCLEEPWMQLRDPLHLERDQIALEELRQLALALGGLDLSLVA